MPLGLSQRGSSRIGSEIASSQEFERGLPMTKDVLTSIETLGAKKMDTQPIQHSELEKLEELEALAMDVMNDF